MQVEALQRYRGKGQQKVTVGHSVAEPRPGAGNRADRRRCAENAGVGCTEARPEAVLPSATRTLSGMGIIRQKPSPASVV
jgi:hypothetical protein